jgi:predicted metalloprotease with PDZ domain
LPNIDIEVACYSSDNAEISKNIAAYIKPLLENQTTYLGGTLPMNKYTFMLYHNVNPEESGFSDGLEHATSTVVLMYLPNDMEFIKNTIYHTVSHEFFHTVMPIGLHSEIIANYDFNNPVYSKHLWLYEGMTEYFTIHMPIKHGLSSLDEFIGVIEGKVTEMKKYNNQLPFVELSKNPIKYQDQYMNVYFKGPLLNLCLDIKLRELSEGKYGVQEMVQDLIEEYGVERPFKDDELFDEIVRISGYGELREFFDKYIKSNDTIPLSAELEKVGLILNWEKERIEMVKSLSNSQKELRKYWINQ